MSDTNSNNTCYSCSCRHEQHEKSSKRLKAAAITITEEHIALLMQASCLTRYVSSIGMTQNSYAGTSYMFSCPGSGEALSSIVAGRKELVRIIQRKKFPEMLESQLIKVKLKASVMNVIWHVKDLVGSGVLMKIETTVGPLYRLNAAASSMVKKK